MTKHRSHSIEFKRQVAQEFLGGETPHGLAKRHDISRNLIRIWVAKSESGAFDGDARAADLMQAYEARIAALKRLLGSRHWNWLWSRPSTPSRSKASKTQRRIPPTSSRPSTTAAVCILHLVRWLDAALDTRDVTGRGTPKEPPGGDRVAGRLSRLPRTHEQSHCLNVAV